jgi:hypothetical protein
MNLDTIGLRSTETQKEIADLNLSNRFKAYTIFFLVSMYFHYHFSTILR